MVKHGGFSLQGMVNLVGRPVTILGQNKNEAENENEPSEKVSAVLSANVVLLEISIK